MPMCTHLFITHLDPIVIESVASEIAAMIVSSVIFPAVDAPGLVRAGFTCRGSGGVLPIGAPPTATWG
jgi:hypothetical protein